MPFSVALLTFDFPPAPTGLGRAAAEIAAGLSDHGVAVTVITLDRSADEKIGNVRVVGAAQHLGAAKQWLRRRAALGHLSAPWAFACTLRDAGPFDLVEATNWYAPAALVPAALPLVVRNSTPACDGFAAHLPTRDRIDLAFANWLEARTARRAAALISNTEHHRTHVKELYRPPTRLPHHVIGLSLPDDVIAKGRSAPVPPDRPPWRFLFVGRAEPRKGFDEALGAFANFHERMTSAGEGAPHLALVGLSDPDFQRRAEALRLSNAVRAAIFNHGRAGDEVLHHALSCCHAVLAPSRYESFGLVYREAAAFGRPLIAAADDPSARAFVRMTKSGVLAERCAAEPLADTMARLVADPAQRKNMRTNGLAHASSLTRCRLGEATLQVYRDVLNSPARR